MTSFALLMLALTAAIAEPEAAQTDQQARALFDRAEINFNLGRFPEALADYQSAYQAEPLPAFVFNIAQCYRNMQDYDRASFFFRRYLTLDRSSPRRVQVEALISEMEALKKAAGATTYPLAGVRAPPIAGPQHVSLVPTSLGGAAAAPADHPGVLRHWWFWAAVGGVLGASMLTVALLADRAKDGNGAMPIDARGQ